MHEDEPMGKREFAQNFKEHVADRLDEFCTDNKEIDIDKIAIAFSSLKRKAYEHDLIPKSALTDWRVPPGAINKDELIGIAKYNKRK